MIRIALPAAALVVTALAGCGSTVESSTGSTSSTALGAGGAAASGDAGLTVGADGATTGPSRGPAGVAGSGGTAGAASGAGAAATLVGGQTAGGSVAASSPGITATKFYVGITYSKNADAANAALGAGGLTSGDEQADAQAVIDEINAHGGIAGRKLVPVWHAYDAQSQDTRANQDQAVCADFNEDHHVAAVIGVGLSDVWNACFTKARVFDIDSGVLIDPDNVMFRQYPYYIEAGTISQDRMMAEFSRTLARLNYFSGWNAGTGQPAPAVKAKVGIVSIDVPEWERPLDHVFLPALRAAGITVNPNDVRRIHNPNSTAEDSQTLAGIQNAVLKLRADGVTHVILLDTSGSFLIFFGKDAKSQHYYPRYGLDSGSGVQAIYDAGLVDSDQLNGAAGLGWNPSLDLSPAAADKYATSGTRRCMKVMKDRTGQTFTSTNAAAIALSYCDELFLLAQAGNAAGSIINADTLRRAVEALGNRFVPAALPAAFFGPGRHDAVELGYDLKWDNSCTCARYTSGPRRIP